MHGSGVCGKAGVCVKYLRKGKEVFWAFMDLEKAYDRVDRQAPGSVLQLFGIAGRLIRAVTSFHKGSRACVRVGRIESDWFEVNIGL